MTLPTSSTLTARTRLDLLALAPVLLGFHPHKSLVMLTFGPGAFHARIDLPATPEDIPAVVGMLMDPVATHGVTRVVFLVYSPLPADTRLMSALLDACGRRGVAVLEALRADGARWFPLLEPDVAGCRVGSREGHGVAYDITSHPFVAQAVLRGQVTHASRDRLADSLAPVPELVDEVSRVLADLPTDPGGPQWPAELAWMAATVSAVADGGPRPRPDTVARLLRDLRDVRLRDVALAEIRRPTLAEQTRLWTEVVRQAPEGWVAAPAALLGFAAWLGGQGALAWCAVERSRSDDPAHSLALRVARLLELAVPPSRWPDDPGARGVQDPA